MIAHGCVPSGGPLIYRKVDHRHGRLVQRLRVRITHDADDFGVELRGPEPPPDRTLSQEVTSGDRLVHDGHSRAVIVIPLVELTPRDEPNTSRDETHPRQSH